MEEYSDQTILENVSMPQIESQSEGSLNGNVFCLTFYSGQRYHKSDTFVNKVALEYNHSYLFMILMAALKVEWQNWVVKKELRVSIA